MKLALAFALVLSAVSLTAQAKMQNDLSSMNGVWKVSKTDSIHVKAGDLIKISVDSNSGTFSASLVNDKLNTPFLESDCSSIDGGQLIEGKAVEVEDLSYSAVTKAVSGADLLSCKQYLVDTPELANPVHDQDLHFETTYEAVGSKLIVSDLIHFVNRKQLTDIKTVLEKAL